MILDHRTETVLMATACAASPCRAILWTVIINGVCAPPYCFYAPAELLRMSGLCQEWGASEVDAMYVGLHIGAAARLRHVKTRILGLQPFLTIGCTGVHPYIDRTHQNHTQHLVGRHLWRLPPKSRTMAHHIT